MQAWASPRLPQLGTGSTGGKLGYFVLSACMDGSNVRTSTPSVNQHVTQHFRAVHASCIIHQ
jgi:hypothetical protein